MKLNFQLRFDFPMSPMHCLGDPQVLYSAKKTLKLGPTVLFIHLKIILLQCFQFSIFSNKQYPNRPLYAYILALLNIFSKYEALPIEFLITQM